MWPFFNKLQVENAINKHAYYLMNEVEIVIPLLFQEEELRAKVTRNLDGWIYSLSSKSPTKHVLTAAVTPQVSTHTYFKNFRKDTRPFPSLTPTLLNRMLIFLSHSQFICGHLSSQQHLRMLHSLHAHIKSTILASLSLVFSHCFNVINNISFLWCLKWF